MRLFVRKASVWECGRCKRQWKLEHSYKSSLSKEWYRTIGYKKGES